VSESEIQLGGTGMPLGAPWPVDTVHSANPSQPLSSGPWRHPYIDANPQCVGASVLPGSSPIHFPSSSLEGGGNPSGSCRTTAGERAGARIHLPHEVHDHPDADLSARLAHIWSHSSDIGVCGGDFGEEFVVD
jgi:hypothetical protein